MHEVNLGEILPAKTSGRDAIHIAIAPVMAGEHLEPGDHVGFIGSDRTMAYRRSTLVLEDGNETLGIVDPFLKEEVRPGQKFYMCLYPRTITTLRHQWSHPAWVPVAPPPAFFQTKKPGQVQAAKPNESCLKDGVFID